MSSPIRVWITCIVAAVDCYFILGFDGFYRIGVNLIWEKDDDEFSGLCWL